MGSWPLAEIIGGASVQAFWYFPISKHFQIYSIGLPPSISQAHRNRQQQREGEGGVQENAKFFSQELRSCVGETK